MRVELIEINKRFERTAAVAAFSLTIESGEFVSLLGPSGSGKTTILNMLAGFLAPDGGKILIGGKDATRLSPAERNIGVVFQQYALFPHLSVSDNVAYGLRRRGWKRPNILARTTEMLELVGLPAVGDRRPSQLSGGQQQRVALARALAFSPGLLLMDEPLAALDRETRVQMRTEIRRIHRELAPTVLYVTHDRDEAFALSDRVVIMRDGATVRAGTPVGIFDDPQSEFVARFYCGFETMPVRVCARDAVSGTTAVDWFGCAGTLRQVEAALVGTSIVIALPPDAIKLADRGAPALVVDNVIMGGNAMLRCRLQHYQPLITVEVSSTEARALRIGSSVMLQVDWSRALAVGRDCVPRRNEAVES